MMLNLITLPVRIVRRCRFALISLGVLIIGLGVWLQINGVPPGVDPLIAVLREVMPVLDEQATIFGMFAKIGGVLALLGLLGLTIHNDSPASAGDSAVSRAMPAPVLPAAANISAPSTWQDRLAAKSEQNPQLRAAPAPRSFGSTLRIGVIGAVVCAFLAVLGATFLGNSGPGAAGPALSLADLSPAQAMIQGHLAGAGVENPSSFNLAAAAEAFAIPQIDPAALVPWAKEQLAGALAGDQAAMITLGSIVGGIFALFLGLKIMFAMRRGKAMQQTRGRRVSYN